MNIGGYISRAKEGFQKAKGQVQARKRVTQAKRLQKLRQERLNEEGMAKLYKLEEQERARLDKAKSTTSKYGGVSRIKKALKGVGRNMENQAVGRGNNPYSLGSTGRGPNWGSTGGGPSWSNVGSPTMRERPVKNLWTVGPQKEARPKKRRAKEYIIIRR